MTTFPTDIFISHSSEDKMCAWRLRADLAIYGVKVWIDEEHLAIGERLTPEIERAICETKHIGILLSSHSMKSGWVKKEIKMAIVRNVRVIPILVEKVSLPREFADTFYVDFTEPEDEKAYHRAFHYLLRELGCHPDANRDLVIYHSGLSIGWENASWSGCWQERCAQKSHARRVVFMARLQAYGGVGFRFRSGIDTSPYARIMFSINGGQHGGQMLKTYVNDRLGNGVKTPYYLDALTPNNWQNIGVPLSKLDAEGKIIFKVNWSDVTGKTSSAFFLSEIRLVAARAKRSGRRSVSA